MMLEMWSTVTLVTGVENPQTQWKICLQAAISSGSPHWLCFAAIIMMDNNNSLYKEGVEVYEQNKKKQCLHVGNTKLIFLFPSGVA